MLIRTAVVWLFERAAELVAGAILARVIFGANDFPPGATELEELRVNLFIVGFFYLASGYIISCVVVGLFVRDIQPLRRGALMAGLFVAHMLFFFVAIGEGAPIPVAAMASGALAVFVINTLGAAALKATTAEFRGHNT